ncbi:MAG: hypothetical protein V4574_20780 [Pseudomonadota bacterium]
MSLDYRDLLLAAADLQEYGGYLSPKAIAERNQIQARFDNHRRPLVYDLFKQGNDAEAHKATVNADLDRIAAAGWIREDAIDYARDELLAHIDKQASNNPLMRFVVRWGPPFAIAVTVIAYAALKLELLQ